MHNFYRVAEDPTILEKYYYQFFTELKNRQIKVIVELYHSDMPKVFPNGWLDPNIKNAFIKYAVQCFNILDEVVDVWVPTGNAHQEVRP